MLDYPRLENFIIILLLLSVLFYFLKDHIIIVFPLIYSLIFTTIFLICKNFFLFFWE